MPWISKGSSSLLPTARYIGLRWSTPIPRKKAKVSRAVAQREKIAAASPESTRQLLRPGKNIVGFVLGEWAVSDSCLLLKSGKYDPDLSLSVARAHSWMLARCFYP